VAVRAHSVRHRLTHFVATFLRSPHATWRTSIPPPLLLFAGLPAGAGPQPPASRQAGAAVYLTGRTVDAAAARQPGTIGQTAVHAEDNAAAMSLMSHRLSPQGR
jgi:hypothetical protein